MTDEKLLTTGEAAELLGVCQRTIRNWTEAGKMQPAQVTLGGHRRYTDLEVRRIAAIIDRQPILRRGRR